MSSTVDLGNDTFTVMRCANCGAAESDDIKLKTCTACKSARYCGIDCQKKHRPMHKKSCKQRAAELRDEILFRQPESSHLGDCPICCLPLPVGVEQCFYMECCSQRVCNGCHYANQRREFMGRLKHKCPFCRAHITKKSDEEFERKIMDRVEANDPAAMCQLGMSLFKKGGHVRAFEYFSKAASLGDVTAHFSAAKCYNEGLGVEKDTKKEVYHLEQASIGGNPLGRYNLGIVEWNNGRKERAVKHWLISAKQGDEPSINRLKEAYEDENGFISKEDFALALRGYQAAVDATKSDQRKEAELLLMRVKSETNSN